MTELERRTLLGDAEAQKQCTEQGIVLPCPKCFKPVNVHGPEDWHPTFYDPDIGGDPYAFECECGLAFGTNYYDFKQALAAWNTRPAPPINLPAAATTLRTIAARADACTPDTAEELLRVADMLDGKEDTNNA